MNRCRHCNYPEDDHNFRHPFEPHVEKPVNWNHRFMGLAHFYAQWSKDPSTKVGAVITNDLGIVQGMGYNGFPRGVDDSPERYGDRAEKLPRVVHAELNAILNANGTVRGSSLFTTLPPCSACACAIIQSGIRRVVLLRSTDEEVSTRWVDSFRIAKEMFEEAGVKVEYV